MFVTVSVDTHMTFNIKYTHSESRSSLKQTIYYDRSDINLFLFKILLKSSSLSLKV